MFIIQTSWRLYIVGGGWSGLLRGKSVGLRTPPSHWWVSYHAESDPRTETACPPPALSRRARGWSRTATAPPAAATRPHPRPTPPSPLPPTRNIRARGNSIVTRRSSLQILILPAGPTSFRMNQSPPWQSLLSSNWATLAYLPCRALPSYNPFKWISHQSSWEAGRLIAFLVVTRKAKFWQVSEPFCWKFHKSEKEESWPHLLLLVLQYLRWRLTVICPALVACPGLREWRSYWGVLPSPPASGVSSSTARSSPAASLSSPSSGSSATPTSSPRQRRALSRSRGEWRGGGEWDSGNFLILTEKCRECIRTKHKMDHSNSELTIRSDVLSLSLMKIISDMWTSCWACPSWSATWSWCTAASTPAGPTWPSTSSSLSPPSSSTGPGSSTWSTPWARARPAKRWIFYLSSPFISW